MSAPLESRVEKLERENTANDGGTRCIYLDPGETAEQAGARWEAEGRSLAGVVFFDEVDQRR